APDQTDCARSRVRRPGQEFHRSHCQALSPPLGDSPAEREFFHLPSSLCENSTRTQHRLDGCNPDIFPLRPNVSVTNLRLPSAEPSRLAWGEGNPRLVRGPNPPPQ